MPLHPKISAGIERLRHFPSLDTLHPEMARQQLRAIALAIRRKVDTPKVASITERMLPGDEGQIRARFYHPETRSPSPLVFFFHGGGFVAGDIDSYDYICRTISAKASVIVMALDYRLAPEHKYPAAVNDCMAAIRWAEAHAAEIGVDPGRRAVAGDSAGGNLAAVCALRLRGHAPALRGQVLVYPVTDHYGAAHPSYLAYSDGYGLTGAEMRWFWDHYLPDGRMACEETVCPLRASDLGELPPSLIVTAEYDVLRDEAEMYAQRLQLAGNTVDLRLAEGMNHGFWLLAGALPEADQSLEDACSWLNQALKHD